MFGFLFSGPTTYSADIIHTLTEIILFALVPASIFVFWQIGRVIKKVKKSMFVKGVRHLVYAFYLANLLFLVGVFHLIEMHEIYGYHAPLWLEVVIFIVAMAMIVLLTKAMVEFSPGSNKRR